MQIFFSKKNTGHSRPICNMQCLFFVSNFQVLSFTSPLIPSKGWGSVMLRTSFIWELIESFLLWNRYWSPSFKILETDTDLPKYLKQILIAIFLDFMIGRPNIIFNVGPDQKPLNGSSYFVQTLLNHQKWEIPYWAAFRVRTLIILSF